MMRRTVLEYLAMTAALTCCVTAWNAVQAQEPQQKPPFEWDATLAGADTTLTLEETNRPPRASTHQAVFYQVKATGFASGESLSLWVKRGLKYFKFNATVTDQGLVQFKLGHDTFGAFVVMAYVRDQGFAVFTPGEGGAKGLLLAGFAEGHPLDVVLASRDLGKRAHAKVVPIPLRADGAGGCSVSAELQSESGLLFLISVKGFLPGETVQIQSQYKKENTGSTKAASQSGELAFPVLFGKGDRGTASLTAATDRCTVRLEYKVGKDALVR